MAATSGTFNLVKITKVEYGDADLVSGAVPSSLTTLGTIKEGKLTIDFPENSPTAEYSEQTQQPYRVRKGLAMKKATMEIVTSLGTEIAALCGWSLAAGSVGSTPDTLSIGSNAQATNKYVLITGTNTNGKAFTVALLNCFVTPIWSGAMGANQETVGVTINFNLLQSAASGNYEAVITAAF